ncbi:ABC transporter ATP-binding protein [Numidum massiliense]|uniref:ABC transporter ATP-binding protein n=1 Tax=Numidum massiliense TaxID=1522315 RepID=UPI0006D563A7|nr:ABC transporter transmembrane domain-containing protein [Numidum massiliense]
MNGTDTHLNDGQANERLARGNVLRRLLSYAKPHKKMLFFAFTVLLIGTAADVLGPILAKIFIDDYLTPRNLHWQPLTLLGVGFFLLYLLSVVMNYFQLLTFQKVALNIVQQLRIDVFSKVQHLGLSFFDKTPGGSLVSRITNDTEAIKDLFVHVLSTFVQNSVFLVGVFIGMFALDAKLAALCLALMPLVIALMFTYRHFSSKVYRTARSKLSQLNAKLNESLQGMSVIQAMRQEKRLRREFGRTNREHYDAIMGNIRLNALLLRPAVDIIYLLALLLVLSFFGINSLNSPIEIGVLYAFISYLDRFFEPINAMMIRLNQYQQAIVSAERVFGLLDDDRLAPNKELVGVAGAEEANRPTQPRSERASVSSVGTPVTGESPVVNGSPVTGKGSITNQAPVIRDGRIAFNDVTFSYDGKVDVLKNISFVANPGETVALVGHTGSGKSSIINLLMRFYHLQSGKITIDGVPLEAYDNDELRRKVGLVLQDSFLFVGDVKQNIRLNNPSISDEDVVKAAEFVQADAFIRKLPQQYEESIGERGATFSSGQRQLLSFARTMALNPKILVLDEATASVDTETEEAIQVALEKMRAGRTTIAIAHRLSTIQDADQILVLHKGEIVERGTHQQLLAAEGLYHKMYLLQQGTSAASAKETSKIG